MTAGYNTFEIRLPFIQCFKFFYCCSILVSRPGDQLLILCTSSHDRKDFSPHAWYSLQAGDGVGRMAVGIVDSKMPRKVSIFRIRHSLPASQSLRYSSDIFCLSSLSTGTADDVRRQESRGVLTLNIFRAHMKFFNLWTVTMHIRIRGSRMSAVCYAAFAAWESTAGSGCCPLSERISLYDRLDR